MENFQVMVILFTIVVLGYVLCKLGYMGDKFDQKLSTIVIDITCPALILSSVMGDTLPDRTLILPLVGIGKPSREPGAQLSDNHEEKIDNRLGNHFF